MNQTLSPTTAWATRLTPPAALPRPEAGGVDAHRGIAGPYTAAGELIRRIVPIALQRWPELLSQHEIEILSVAPDLSSVVPPNHETMASLAIPGEHTRFHSPMRIVRIAHGLVDLICEHLRRCGEPVTLFFDQIDEADRTDLEFLAALSRRADPQQVRVALRTRRDRLPTPLSDLGQILERIPDGAEHWPSSTRVRAEHPGLLDALDPVSLHASEQACQLLEVAAALLVPVRCASSRTDDRDDAVATLLAALRYCLDMGFYDATVEFGNRVRELATWSSHPAARRKVVAQMGMALMVTGRLEEVGALFAEGRANSTDPTMHLQVCYGYAMMATRYIDTDRRDHDAARQWINTAIAFCASWPDPAERAFLTVFHQNALALVEVHMGRPAAALKLLDDGLARMAADVPEGEHHLHRSVLLYNRAQVHASLGNNAQALADYTTVIEQDPFHPEYHFDRAGLLRRLGRPLEALADYDSAVACSPPFAEALYNRADVLMELGEHEAALAGFGYVLQIDPTNVAAHINYASLLLERGEVAQARLHVANGLKLEPGQPQLHCLQAELALSDGSPWEAVTCYDCALQGEPALLEAWVGRAGVWFALGEPDRAVTDLDEAVRLSNEPTIRFNRALALQASGELDRARADLRTALLADPFFVDAAVLLEALSPDAALSGP